MQDKVKEIAFFDNHATSENYDVFTSNSNKKLIDTFVASTGACSGDLIADLGCGSGVFTSLLSEKGFNTVGVDLSYRLLSRNSRGVSPVSLVTGDVEMLPFSSDSLDHILLSGLVHHLPDPSHCAHEVARTLKSGGKFFAFDPNRMNPFMYLYRDPDSPLYSNIGVTENERPIIPKDAARVFQNAGLVVRTSFLSGLSYRYVASSFVRQLLFVYNTIDQIAFKLPPLKRFSPFVLTFGYKP